MAIDPGFGTDNFGSPKMYSETETLVNNILTVLFGKPGAYPTMPNLGMNVPQYVLTLYDEISEDDLKNQLIQNCSSFSEVVRNGEFNVIKTILKDAFGNDAPTILFKIPTLIKNTSRSLIIGITSSNNQVTYNFSWIEGE